jgi:lipoprotein-anchoring transpeptidase ErfK/SrfK
MSEPVALQLQLSLPVQRLWLVGTAGPEAGWPVSTARNGPGERKDSECTPRGWHQIRAKIGDHCPPGTVFVARRPTGERYHRELAEAQPQRDWILTRILWLSGLEPGRNRLGACDTMRRYIYIHGAPDSVPMGEPGSHGCIRMRNADVMELYRRVPVHTALWITEDVLSQPRWRPPLT